MSYFNLSQYANTVDISGLMTYTNNITDSWFAYLIIIVYYLIVFLMFKSYDTKMVFFTSSISFSIITVLLYLTSFVNISVVIMSVILVATSTFIYMWRGD